MYVNLSIILRKTHKLWKTGFERNIKTSKIVEPWENKELHIEGLHKFQRNFHKILLVWSNGKGCKK